MQISRLFKIVYLLQDKKQMTAKELADYFEVSTRTILRDINTLSEAGIPVYTTQGKGGGIFIMDHFILNKTTISKEEQERILFALQSLVQTEQLEENELLTKLQTFFQNTKSSWIEVDFSRWGFGKVEKKQFHSIKEAILQRRVISFDYASSYGETVGRRVNPLRLVFKRNAWYLQGYCQWREDYRTFRISRISNMKITDEVFQPEDFEEGSPDINIMPGFMPDLSRLVLEFTKEAAYRAYDDFAAEEITKRADGSLLVDSKAVFEPGFYDYLLSLGKGVRVIEPEFVKDELLKLIEEIKNNYTDLK
ncbi:MAG: helix-turn-helix transcriptional regulator [Lachnospiraceae bacterium]